MLTTLTDANKPGEHGQPLDWQHPSARVPVNHRLALGDRFYALGLVGPLAETRDN